MSLVNNSELLKGIYESKIATIFDFQSVPQNGIRESEIQKTLLDKYIECSDCHNEHKKYVLPLLKELFRSKNHEVLRILDAFESDVKTSDLNNFAKSDLLFLAFSFKVSSKSYLIQTEISTEETGFWDCFRSNAGGNVGEGIAYGFLGGCMAGGIAGVEVR